MLTMILTLYTIITLVSSAAVKGIDLDEDIKIVVLRANNEVLRANNEDFITTIGELSRIFGRKRREYKKLSKDEIKKARSCRKKKLLYSTKDESCHPPTTRGPCRDGKWFVAVKERLDGVCRKPPCNNDEVFYDGSCTPVDEKKAVCPEFQQLYVNKKGFGFCDCQSGFSYSIAKNTCYRELVGGPCEEEGEVWSGVPKNSIPKEVRERLQFGVKKFGECQSSGCDAGYVKWSDNKCYKMKASTMCLESETGDLELIEDEVTCSSSMGGRSTIGGRGGGCRKGRAWSNRRQRCIRVFRG